MVRVLILAYGNPLRSDDGVAWRAADLLAAKYSEPEIEILRLHQLAPELAETISHFKAVIFIDAAIAGARSSAGQIRVEEMNPEKVAEAEAPRFTHALSPQMIVTLAATLYKARPRAFLLTVIGESFDHGESLSAPVAAAVPALVRKVAEFLRSFPEEA